MSVRVSLAPQAPGYEQKPWAHPLECEICEGAKHVKAFRVGPHPQNQSLAWWLPSRLSVVIPCPQCSGADELYALLPRDAGGGE